MAGDGPELRVLETHATSADGAPVHLFVLSGTGAPDQPRPTVLYGYGGFNVSLTPAYSAQALAWVAVRCGRCCAGRACCCGRRSASPTRRSGT